MVTQNTGRNGAQQSLHRKTATKTRVDGSIQVLQTLKPLGVAMASDDVVDPYKD